MWKTKIGLLTIQKIFFRIHPDLQTNSFDNARPPVTSMNLDKLWINFMKKGEFNPVHDHSGNISFVIYTSVPNEILMENKNLRKRIRPRLYAFSWRKLRKLQISIIFYLKQDICLFSQILKTLVPPFKSNVTRISVSGNLTSFSSNYSIYK